jgi:hypothetical protein
MSDYVKKRRNNQRDENSKEPMGILDTLYDAYESDDSLM